MNTIGSILIYFILALIVIWIITLILFMVIVMKWNKDYDSYEHKRQTFTLIKNQQKDKKSQ